MTWVKQGLIYKPKGDYGWDVHTVLTPTPFLLNDDVIRIYAGFRDELGVSRIGYLDVAADNPKEVLSVSKKPVLDTGRPGMFDDNGMLLGDIVQDGKKIRMYYVGFQIPKKAKFLAYSGLAISTDGGESFVRHQETPIMDRTSNALYIRAIHSVIHDGDTWKIWYSVGNGWEVIGGVDYPQYDIRYVESKDGIVIDYEDGIHCIGVEKLEYRIGRPRVRKIANDLYEMRYTHDNLSKEYRTGYAESCDGIHWTRMDEKVGIFPSEEGWDSEMLCYPVIIRAKNKLYMFYSGNGMGATGVGYAVWEDNA